MFIIGTKRADLILGTLANDTIRGGGGNDVLYGGSAAPSSFEPNGDDFIFGGFGDDFIGGGGGNDTLYGGTGNNELHVGTGMNNVYLTGSGRDLVGAPRVDWTDPLDGRNLVHIDKDGGHVRMYGASSRTHFDLENDDQVEVVSQRIDGNALVIRAVDDDTTITIKMSYWLPGQEARLLSSLELDGLFV